MIDIHCHLLYGVDDGAKTIEESVAMLEAAKEQGISIENAEKLYDWSGFYDVLTEADVKGLAADQQFLIDNGMMEKAVDVRSLILPGAMK